MLLALSCCFKESRKLSNHFNRSRFSKITDHYFRAIAGTPVAGVIYEKFNAYDVPFYFAGAMLTASAVILLPLECVNRWEKKHAAKQQNAA
jgi:hypothetical protein